MVIFIISFLVWLKHYYTLDFSAFLIRHFYENGFFIYAVFEVLFVILIMKISKKKG